MVKHQQFIDFDLDRYPIQLRTDSEIGSGEAIDICFYTSTETDIFKWGDVGNIWIVFSDPMTYRVYHYTDEFTTFGNVSIPGARIRKWQIKKTAWKLQILCNDVKVIQIVFDTVRNLWS